MFRKVPLSAGFCVVGNLLTWAHFPGNTKPFGAHYVWEETPCSLFSLDTLYYTQIVPNDGDGCTHINLNILFGARTRRHHSAQSL